MSKVFAAFGDKHRQRILLFFEPDLDALGNWPPFRS